MKTNSAWLRALAYGSACGGILGLVIGAGAFWGGASWQEGMYATGVSAFLWGCVGFFLGFVSLRQRSAPAADISIRSAPSSIAKVWIYRVFAGLALGMLGATIVELMVIGVVAFFFGGLDGYLNRKHPPEEVRLHLLVSLAMFGSATSAMIGGFLGVMVAPLRFESRGIIRISLLSSASAALAGGWLGGCVGLLDRHLLSFDQSVTLALAAGAAAGIVVALVVRAFAISEGSQSRATSVSDDSSPATSKASETSITQRDL
jgi:hypothetical protein